MPSFAATRRERFLQDGQAEVRASVDLAGMAAVQLSLGDRQAGTTAMDQVLCRSFAPENRDCSLRRPASGFVMPPVYRIDATLVDLQALERAGAGYVRTQSALAEDWEFFARYRRTGQLADIYLGAPEVLSHDVTLTGATIDAPALRCRVRSPWIDVDLEGAPAGSDYRYRYRSLRKVGWFSHADITSEAFGQAIEQGRKCVASLRMTVAPPDR